MARLAPTLPKGTRDYLPRDLVRRNRVFGLLRETFERYGYEPLETPAVESTHVLEGKYGDEGERLLFRILKRGHDLDSAAEVVRDAAAAELTAGALSRELADMALRYDLTVPFARVIASHQNDLVLPFRRYQMQPVWRAERPQRGRYREFYQCDVDCVGSTSVTVEAEMLAMVNEVMGAIGFSDFTIRVNHRALLAALMEGAGVPEDRRGVTLVIVDKLEKIGAEGVREELTSAGLDGVTTARLLETLSASGSSLEIIEQLHATVGKTERGAHALRELTDLFGYLSALGVPPERAVLDISTVRGLAYYTGIIYETFSAGAPVGSLASGGRYDQLIGLFLGRDIPCVGVSFGIDRIFAAMDLLKLGSEETPTTTQALVTVFAPETIAAAFEVAAQLRRAGINTEVYAEPKDLGTQLKFADKKGIPIACVIGPDEIARGEVVLRDLASREQRSVPLADAPERARAMLGERSSGRAGAAAGER